MLSSPSPGSINATPIQVAVPQSRPRVNARNPDLRALTSITWAAVKLVNAPPEFFNRENAIIHIPASSTADTVSCQQVGVDRLKWWLTQHIDFFQDKNGIQMPARPPLDLLRNMLAAPDPPLPSLIGIVRHPIFGRDGALQTQPGYSPATQRYHVPDSGLVVPAISDYPTQQEIDQAKANLLAELLGDFPFVDDPSRAHTLAALLLPFVRPMITGPTPLHLIWKPKPGTGATLLAEILCLPSCGSPSVINVSKDEDERRRTILATLGNGPGAVLLDNVRSLQGEALASCLTQIVFEDRLIGTSRLLRLPNVSLWLATGNNPGLSDEIVRRTIPIHLDAKLEHPDLKTDFRHPLPKWAVVQRPLLIWSALTLIRAWIVAGKPECGKTLGKFEGWATVIGGILEVAKVPGFLERLDEFRTRADSETANVRDFIEAWAGKFDFREVRVSELMPLAASLDLGTGTEASQSIRLGKLLAERQGQQLRGWRIEKGAKISGNQQWRLEPIAASSGSGGSGGDAPTLQIESDSHSPLGVSSTSTTSTKSEDTVS